MRLMPLECECGKPPSVMYAGEWMCERCRQLQRESREIKERYANQGRTPTRYLKYVPKEKVILNFAELYNDALETPLESFSRLESMLADPQKTLMEYEHSIQTCLPV